MRKRFGLIRLHALPALDVWHARNTVTQHVAGPRSTATVALAAAGLRFGDLAGLALFRRPYACIAVERARNGLHVTQFDEQTGRTSRVPLSRTRVWLRAECDFIGTTAGFWFSTDGTSYTKIGEPYTMANGCRAVESIACSLFSCSAGGPAEGGHADFDSFVVTTQPARDWEGA